MVRISRNLMISKAKLGLVLVVLMLPCLYFSVKVFQRHGRCIIEEPIDVVYTWVNGSDPKFLKALEEQAKLTDGKIDASKQRFEDKGELRFSLRSLEKYAPWVNHVYLVTNGQIPYWLNLDYEKITVVTHEQIFRNPNNLPSFSSPAIESNLHRIPGLSKKFIYFNDDIFLGQPLYREDFYSYYQGYSVYLSYPVPQCSKNCPWVYVGDGQCDKACNNEGCQYDGGDCDPANDVVFRGHSEEETESYYDKVKREFEEIGTKKRKRRDLSTTAYNLQGFNNKTENSSHELDLRKARNGSLSQLVNEYNKKVVEANKRSANKNKLVNLLKITEKPPLDGFLESLWHTNRMLNRKFGFKARQVPAHAPILIDKDIMKELQSTFSEEIKVTEQNKFRHKDDVQFAFSYYYFLMSQMMDKSVEDIFDYFDTDGSGTWSDREIRNLLTKVYALPLSYDVVDHFEDVLIKCSELRAVPQVPTPLYERYIDSRLPTISKDVVTNCPVLTKYLKKRFGLAPKYKFSIREQADRNFGTFKMLYSNVTDVVVKLDEIRRKMTKFICLNDNLNEWKAAENDLINAVLYDFYISLFPHSSKFELPEHSRNRFLHMDELNQWRNQLHQLQTFLSVVLFFTVIFTFFGCITKVFCNLISRFFCVSGK